MSKKREIKAPPCYGNHENPDPKFNCETCKADAKCKEIRLAIRNDIIRKLDSGFRPYIVGHLWSKGDALASSPLNDDNRLIMLLEAYIEVFGLTDSGLTGLADKDLYDKVVDYHDDLISFLDVWKETFPKCKTPEEFDIYIKPVLQELEEKYSRRVGEKIEGNPTKLLRTIKSLVYKEIYPKIMAQISQVASLQSGGFPGMFNPQAVPRFRTPQLDGKTQRP